MNYTSLATDIENKLNEFVKIDLKELDQVKLLNRIDSKYIIHISQFVELLEELKPYYKVLKIEDKMIHTYESLYFDTDDFTLYNYHHNGKADRFKTRYRKYVDSGLCYFEVKYKDKANRTDKKRVKKEDIILALDDRDKSIIEHNQVDVSALKPQVWIYFKRITLANNNMKERLTLDIDISFKRHEQSQAFPHLVIIEIKQDKSSSSSDILSALKKRHLEEIGFSKYATAIALMENVKSNNFKPNFIKLKKLEEKYGRHSE
ncbi:MAG: polyphosphate polymerase domain-containing protein [Bacteroidota bacterium]